MATSTAATVEEYLEELPEDRAAVVAHVRELVIASLPPGYVEGMLYGMITWMVPLEIYPRHYNGKPLAYVSLAAQKNYYALYLMGVYADSAEEARLRQEWVARGTKLDMGKCCLRFKRVADLHEDLVAEVIARSRWTSTWRRRGRRTRARGEPSSVARPSGVSAGSVPHSRAWTSPSWTSRNARLSRSCTLAPTR